MEINAPFIRRYLCKNLFGNKPLTIELCQDAYGTTTKRDTIVSATRFGYC